MIKTIRFNARLPVLLGASPFYLTPASPIASHFDLRPETMSLKRGLLPWPFETPDFDRGDIYHAFHHDPNPEFSSRG